VSLRPRQIVPVALVLVLTIAGFLIARVLAEQDARADSDRRAEVAAAQIHGRIAQAASLTESLRRFMLDAGGTGVTSDQFTRNASRWLSTADFPASAWVEPLPAQKRAAYERRIGQPLVTPDDRPVPPVESRSSYLPATLVSGFQPVALPGTDLSRQPGMARALRRATRVDGVVATPVSASRTGTSGLFLVAPAPKLVDGVLHPGYAVVFAPDVTLRAATSDPSTVQITTRSTSEQDRERAKTASATFMAAGQRFDVVVPEESISDPGAALPWIILAAGFVLAALAAALGANGARRAKAQAELDRIFNLSPDVIAVADFEGLLTRVNPAASRVLGYTEEELLSRPYLEFVHPEDRERTAADAAAIAEGKMTLSFGNRFVHKDGSYRALEWTATPVPEDRVMYAVARDVTHRRQAEAQVERLAEEQAALRRVATLVAHDASQAEVFTAISESAGQLLGTEEIRMMRYEDERSAVVVARWGGAGDLMPVGARLPLEGDSTTSRVLRTGKPARIDDYARLSGPAGDAARPAAIRCVVATPVVVEGRLWGAITAGTTRAEPLPADTELRLGQFTELMATTIANTESHARAERLTHEQAALRRVATLVAKEEPPAEVFDKVAEEAATVIEDVECVLLRDEGDRIASVVGARGAEMAARFPVGTRLPTDGDGLLARVLRERRPRRIDDYSGAGDIAQGARERGISSAVGCPIVVRGGTWGAMVVARFDGEPCPPHTEQRVARFADLVATAVGNAEARAEVERLADEQAALRRIATLVAEGVRPVEIFSAVSKEVGRLLGTDLASVTRFEDDPPAHVVVGLAKETEGVAIGSRWELDDRMASAEVYRTGRSARIDGPDWSTAGKPIGELARRLATVSSVSSPIVVGGRMWGAINMTSTEPLPLHAEERVEKFTELVATAIANAESREAVRRLVDEQAALRRVATLVAEGAPPSAVLDAVAGEMEALLDADQVALNRFEPGNEILVLAHRGLDVQRTPVGSRVSVEGESATAKLRRTGQPARLEGYGSVEGALAELARATGLRSSVSAPIVVEGGLWGVITASWKGEQSPPSDTEERMSKFARLLDTAIANTEARAEIERLAEEQAALRRVATLVAQGAAPTAVFDAVAAEMARLLRAGDVAVCRYEAGAELTVLAHRGSSARELPPGARIDQSGDSVEAAVRRTERSARVESYEGARGAIAEIARAAGVRVAVGAPIVVDGRLWGVVSAGWKLEDSPPVDAEERMAQFARLLDTAIANADSREQLMASRARLLTAADEARRRVVRDLHDGAQQRLVHTIVTLKLAQRAFSGGDGKAEALVRQALRHAERSNAELRELAHGILPAVLTRGGLRAGVDAFVTRVDLPVRVDVPAERFPSEVEATAYFVVAEALTNVLKHSHAGRAEVGVSVDGATLHVEVRDDGMGGADPHGHGLVGMADRVTALGGRLELESPVGAGTRVTVTLPISAN
jgi:PAS domain S-box-containing protein